MEPNVIFDPMKGISTTLLLILILALGVLNSCRKDDFSDDNSLKLEFSTDTVLFDTVFTTVGSSTEIFIVYNKNDKALRISSIRLGGGGSSQFRLNMNGLPGNNFSDIELLAGDSLFVFAEVTVDPNNQNTPLVVTDSLLFETNGNLQKVQLVAWGQDAYFHRSPTGGAFLLCNEDWNKDKPHVVYGQALVDSGCYLNINAGTNVHLHPGSSIIVLSSGTLNMNGTSSEPVTVQGDRLGEDFKDIPGQWDRIWFSNITRSRLINGTNEIGPGSRNSVIRHAIIKNGTIGLQVDTVFAPGATTLRIENSIIKNMSFNGLAGLGSTVIAFNSVFANCGAQTANLLIGGSYEFYHCTFANYWTNGTRQDPAVSFNNYFDANVRRIDALFRNCIVHGNLETEIGVDSFPRAAPGQCNFTFDHCLIKLENTYPTSNTAFFRNIIRSDFSNNRPRFKDIDENDYSLDSLSAAIDVGDPAALTSDPVLLQDILGNIRPRGNGPDLGAYERQ
ncbi:MAG: choice-of-anchor Q domain-containing protein [Bacteroidota bacterium]